MYLNTFLRLKIIFGQICSRIQMIDVNYLTSPSKMQDTRDMVNIIAICKKKVNDNQNNLPFPLFALAKSLNKYKTLTFLAFSYKVKKNENILECKYISSQIENSPH